MDFSSAWWVTLADLFVNLSAGWFGAAFIIPITVKVQKLKLTPLLFNLFLSIIFYILAVIIRSI